jgi:hypothetical protein
MKSNKMINSENSSLPNKTTTKGMTQFRFFHSIPTALVAHELSTFSHITSGYQHPHTPKPHNFIWLVAFGISTYSAHATYIAETDKETIYYCSTCCFPFLPTIHRIEALTFPVGVALSALEWARMSLSKLPYDIH